MNRTPPLRHALAAALVTGLLASAVPSAGAQGDLISSEIQDGTFTGGISLVGGFTIEAGGPGFGTRWTLNINGPATLQVVDGVVTGSWGQTGTGTGIAAGQAGDGTTVGFTADTVFDATGTIDGTADAAVINGDVMVDITATGTGLGAPVSTSETVATSQPLEDVLAGCGQVVATYQNRINVLIEETPNADANLRGVLAVYTDADEDRDRIEELTEQVAALTNIADPVAQIGTAGALLFEVLDFQAELAQRGVCEGQKEFFTMLALATERLLGTAIGTLRTALASGDPRAANLTASSLSALLTLGLSSGAIGSGSPLENDLLVQAREVAQTAYTELLSTTPLDVFALRELAAASVQFGWDLQAPNGEVSDHDVVNTFPPESDE